VSQFSGRCDLANYIEGLSGWRDKNGNKVDDTYFNPRYGNEWEDFLVFKKQTKGLLHQHKKVTVSEWNQEEVKERCHQFDFTEHVRVIKDKRFKKGVREEKYFTYTYWNKEYESLKELNKKGVYITIDIPFETLLDLIPYYPYTVSAAACNNEGSYIVISEKPYPIEQRDESLSKGGKLFDYWQSYAKKLQEHYREVVLKYYNPTGREIIERINFELDSKGRYIAHTRFPVDDNFKLDWEFAIESKTHWTSPKLIDENTIEMSKQDAEKFLGTSMEVKYVRVKE
jgi:hypothetical protein